MVSVLLLMLGLTSAFEFDPPASAMLAGTASAQISSAATLNSGLLTSLDQSSVDLRYVEPYGLADVQYQCGEFAIRRVALGGRFSLLASDGYQEMTAALGKGFRLHSHLSFGAAFSAYYLRVAQEIAAMSCGLSAGAAWVDQRLGFGAAVENFNRPVLSTGDVLPTRLRLGVSYRPFSDLQLAADGLYDQVWQLKLGCTFSLARCSVWPSVWRRIRELCRRRELPVSRAERGLRLFLQSPLAANPRSRRGLQLLMLLLAFALIAANPESDLLEDDVALPTEYNWSDILADLRRNPIDLNSASADELLRVPYLTPHLARALIEYRAARGPLRDFSEFAAGCGFDPATRDAIRRMSRYPLEHKPGVTGSWRPGKSGDLTEGDSFASTALASRLAIKLGASASRWCRPRTRARPMSLICRRGSQLHTAIRQGSWPATTTEFRPGTRLRASPVLRVGNSTLGSPSLSGIRPPTTFAENSLFRGAALAQAAGPCRPRSSCRRPAGRRSEFGLHDSQHQLHWYSR